MARIGTAYISVEGDFTPLRRQLASMKLRGSDALTIDVKADWDRSAATRVEADKAKLGKTEEFKVKADVSQARQATALLTKESAGLSDVFNRSNLSIGQWTAIIAAASPVIVDMVGALGALTASAAAATAGLGALAVGGAGALAVGIGGIVAIAAPAISSLKDLMTAQQAANKSQATGAQSAARSQAAAQQQIKTSTEAVTAAENGLKVAQETEATAQKALTQARADAVRQLEDMRRAAIEGGTSEKRARLSIQQAEANLRQLRASGTASALDIKDAELSVTEARQSAKDVSIQATRAQQDYNKAQKQGIDKMPGVVAAQQSLDSATRGVANAQTSLAKATQNLAFQQKQATTATQAGGTALAALQLAQKKAGPAAVKFAANLKQLGSRWRQLTAAGKADFFGALGDGLDVLNKKLPLFARSANSSMEALRGGFDKFLAQATGPGFNKFVNVMTRTFANSMGPIGQAFGNIATALERIAVAVAPDIVRMVKGFEGMTQGWVDSTRNAADLRDTVHGLVNQANTWWKLIKATANLIKAALVPGMGQGKKAVEGITASIKEWTRWLNQHPEAVRGFMKEGLKTTGQLAQVLLGFIPQIIQISTAMRPIARGFLGITEALNSIKIGNVTALTALLGAFVAASGIKKVGGAIGAFASLPGAKTLGRKVAPGLVKAAAPTAVGGAELTGAAAALTGSAEALTAAAAELAGSSAIPGVPGRAAAPLERAAAPLEQTAKGVVLPAGVTAAAVAPEAAAAAAPEAAAAGGLAGLVAAAPIIAAVAAAVAALGLAFVDLKTNFLGVTDLLKGAFHSVFDPLAGAFTELVKTITGGGGVGDALSAIGDALSAVWKVAWPVIQVLGKIVGLVVIAAAVFNPLTILIVGMVAGLTLLFKGLTLAVKGIIWLVQAIKDVVKVVSGPIGKIAHVLIQPFKLWFQVVKFEVGLIIKVIGGVFNFVKDHAGTILGVLTAPFRAWFRVASFVVGKVIGVVKDVVSFVKDHWGSIEHVLKAPFQGIASFVEGVFNGLKGIVIGVINDLIAAFNKVFDRSIDTGIPGVPEFHGIHIDPISTGGGGGRVTGHQALHSQRRQPRLIGHPGRAGGQRGGMVTVNGIVPLMGFQGGGVVGQHGLRPGPRDKIPALLEVGELVIPKKLVDTTRRNAKATALALHGEIGKGYAKVLALAKDFVKGHGEQFGKLRTDAQKDTKAFRKDTVDDFEKASARGSQEVVQLRKNVSDGMSKARGDATDASQKMRVGVVADFNSMASATKDALKRIEDQTNKALKALGVKPVNFGLAQTGKGEGQGQPHHAQTGAMIVPGKGTGDSVPVHAMTEPGEVLAVLNRKAAQKWMQWNAEFPRFQKGGMAAMVNEANRFESHHFPYRWGGGHGDFGVQPVDCSGAVSDVLHAAGLLTAPMVSGALMHWGKSGKGPLTVWAGPNHVVMGLDGRVFGTSGTNPAGGAGWIDQTKDGKALVAATGGPVATRTMDVVGAAGRVKRVLVEGAIGPVLSIAQAIADRVREGANSWIQKKTPAGIFGGGQAEGFYKGPLNRTFPHPGVGEPPPFLAPWQAAMLAERAGLPGITYAQIAHGESNFSPGAISHDGGFGLWQMTPRVQSAQTVAAWKRIGSYFNPWANARMAKVLAGSGTGVSNYFGTKFLTDPNRHWHGEKHFQGGGIMAPFVGSFNGGGLVPRTGLGLVHAGEEVLPSMQHGGTVSRLHWEAERVRHRARVAERELARERAKPGKPDKQLVHHLEKLTKQLAIHEAKLHELIGEQKQNHQDNRERNRLLEEVRRSERPGVRSLANLFASEIGFNYRQNVRNPGSIGSTWRT